MAGGGGVFRRSAKSIPISAPMRERFAIEAEQLTPAELIAALLRAPVDLIWNGGIGTYVKASRQSHADCGDKANDPLRVDALPAHEFAQPLVQALDHRVVRVDVRQAHGSPSLTTTGRRRYPRWAKRPVAAPNQPRRAERAEDPAGKLWTTGTGGASGIGFRTGNS